MNKKEMILLYLLMSVDGKVSKEEDAKFNEALSQYGLTAERGEIKNAVKKICKEVDIAGNNMQEVFDAYLEETGQSDIYAGDTELRTLLWLMVSMSFADGVCCENEKNLMKCLAENRIDWSVAEDMMDCANAMLSIEKELNWLKTAKGMSSDEITCIKNELNLNKTVLEENVSILIG